MRELGQLALMLSMIFAALLCFYAGVVKESIHFSLCGIGCIVGALVISPKSKVAE